MAEHPITLRSEFDFIVKTAAGAPIFTSDRSELALRFARSNRDAYPGLHVDTVTVVTTTRRLWTDRKANERRAA